MENNSCYLLNLNFYSLFSITRNQNKINFFKKPLFYQSESVTLT